MVWFDVCDRTRNRMQIFRKNDTLVYESWRSKRIGDGYQTKAMPPVKTKLLIPDMGHYLSDNADLRDLSTSLNNEALRASTMSSKSACAKFQRVGSPCCIGTYPLPNGVTI